jgi:DNA-binding transcriptional regulator/RsmH inhibitor MraZ
MPQRKPVTTIDFAETIFGEFEKFTVTSDHRVVIPAEFRCKLNLDKEGDTCVLALECDGCISVWHETTWRSRLESVTSLYANDVAVHTDASQLLGRLLATRIVTHIEDGGRILIPPRFRQDVISEDREGRRTRSYVTMVSNGLCLEIWHPDAWKAFRKSSRPSLWELVDSLSAPTA